MSDITILKEMIKGTATVSLIDSDHNERRKRVILAETSANYSVPIYGMPEPDDVIVIKADAFPALTMVFANSRGECKRADFIIVANTGERKVILCIEMKAKATTSLESEIIQQLKGAQCFVAYCQAIGKVFWGQENFLDSYDYRFINIRNINIPKSMTRIDPETGIHDSPERMSKINFPGHLEFNKLVGKMSKK
ncbi:MAG: hypothetical protein BWK78_04005 [Thiotrichaceae bacterium IS1]|nr:MAG: hypothetical protein BWK78_04005 [Thiotrichaceae bacterium IS1]